VFDPFGDYETAGYLQNLSCLKDPRQIKIQEHLHFTTNLPDAAAYLAKQDEITYRDFCAVHQILFSDFYPWAGRDRRQLGVAQLVSKGERIQFEEADQAQRAIEYALELGNDVGRIAARPGEVMGLFAWGHPFLDGNGRTMVVVHTELMARAKLMINWGASSKDAYLEALTREIESPRDHALDDYLKPLVEPLPRGYVWIDAIRSLPGLDGSLDDIGADVSYDAGDPEGARRYAQAQERRQYEIPETRVASRRPRAR